MGLIVLPKHNYAPESAMGWLIGEFNKHIHIPDPLPLFVILGAISANMHDGISVNLMLKSVSSGGKSLFLNSLLGIGGLHSVAHITNESAFLSGTGKKDRAKDATGGLLREVGEHGGVVFNDFTSVLGLRKESFDAVMAVIRETYSGTYTRVIGGEGGKKLTWRGKVSYYAGVTGAIDQKHEANSSLGERWLYYRMPESDGWERSKKMNQAMGPWEHNLRDIVQAFFAGLDLEFGHMYPKRQLTAAELHWIFTKGKFAATARSPVVRDRYSRTHRIIAAKETESETRIVAAMSQLYLGMEAIGVTETDRKRALRAITLDSMPELRSIVITQIQKHGATDYAKLANVMGCSVFQAKETVQDLEVHGVVKVTKKDKEIEIDFSKETREVMAEWRK